MKLTFGRILSFAGMAVGWMLAGVRLVLDAIGYSTAPDDVAVAQTRLDQAVSLVLQAPWWSIWGFALLTTLWLIHVSWPRQKVLAPSASTVVAGREEGTPENKLAALGHRCLDMADDIEWTRLNGDDASDLLIQLGSLMRVVRRHGLEAPEQGMASAGQYLDQTEVYLKGVGQNLIDENFDDAREIARNVTAALRALQATKIEHPRQ